MMQRIRGSLLGVGFVFALSACGEPDLLHYRNPPPHDIAFEEAQVREMVNGGRVDILFVIDNSGSMGVHQTRLSQATGDFIGEFVKRGSGFDWQIGIVSSDITNAPFLGFTPSTKCDKNSANPEGLFKAAMARVGTSGDYIERFLQPMIQHLSRGTFLRPHSYFAVFFMTDATEQSSSSVQSYYNQLVGMVGDASRVLTYGAFATNDTRLCDNEGWSWNGTTTDERRWKDYFALGKASTRYDLCQNNLGRQMADFAKDLIVKVDSPKIFLKDRPVPYTIRVNYEGNDVPGGKYKEPGAVWFYDYQLNAIVFKNLDSFPQDTSKIQITYAIDDGRPDEQ